ncbi:CaiB/BaiF CoA transferase family protein [Chloroflexota bacterium]
MENKTLLGPYRVLDLCNETGALCGKIFADLGADVIRIEKPGGDSSRKVGPFYHDESGPEKSLFWFSCNTSKRGITLDIETEEGREIFKKLVKTADFVFETFPPGRMSDLGLGHEELCQIRPEIIMTSITPFGQTGPYKDFKTSDLVALGMGGVMRLAGDPDQAPLRFSVEQAYSQTGAQTAAATMIALHHRQLTSEGQHLDSSIQECCIGFGMSVQQWELAQIISTRQGIKVERAGLKPRLIWNCKDGYVSWRLYTADQGVKTNAIVDCMREWGEMEPEVENADFTTMDFNFVSEEELETWEAGFAKFFAKHTKDELYGEAAKRDIMLFPINDTEDLLNNVQLTDRQYWVNVEHPELGETIIYPGAPFKTTETSWQISRRAPLVGEHNEEIYEKELGMTKQQLSGLKEQGVI